MISPSEDVTHQMWVAPDNPSYDVYLNQTEPIVIKEKKTVERSHTYLYLLQSVIKKLKSGEEASGEYLIRPTFCAEEKDLTARDAALQTWCDQYLPDGQILEKIGYVRWYGSTEALLALASASQEILVCFIDDFESIHGMSIEKAQAMIDAGELDIWSCPVEGSPLYGKTPAEIAAYLAENDLP